MATRKRRATRKCRPIKRGEWFYLTLICLIVVGIQAAVLWQQAELRSLLSDLVKKAGEIGIVIQCPHLGNGAVFHSNQ